MSGGSAEPLLPPDNAAIKESASSPASDRLAALLGGPDRPSTYDVDELLRAWRDAQQDAKEVYAAWRGPSPSGGHPAYLAALDREERAAEVYANLQRRALEWKP